MNRGILVLAIGLLAVDVGAQERDLLPERGSDAVPGGVHVKKHPDGSMEVSGHGTVNAGDPPQAFSIEGVDPDKGTYRAKKVPNTHSTPTEHESWGRPESNIRPQSYAPADGDWRALLHQVDYWTPGNWWHAMTLVGTDPVKIQCNAT